MYHLLGSEWRKPQLKEVALGVGILLLASLGITIAVNNSSNLHEVQPNNVSQSAPKSSAQEVAVDCQTSTVFPITDSMTASICHNELGHFYLKLHSLNSTVTLPLNEFKELLNFFLLPMIDELVVVASVNRNVTRLAK